MFLYDQDCGFCTRAARRLESIVGPQTQVVASQSLDLAALGLTADDVQRAAWYVTAEGKFSGHLAIARALQEGSFRWRVVGRLLAMLPVSWLAGPIYRLIARNRSRLSRGGSCGLR